MSEEALNPYVEYRDDMNRVADMLDAASKIPGSIRGRVPHRVKMRFRARNYQARLCAAGAPVPVQIDRDQVEVQSRHVLHVNDGLYVSSAQLGMPQPGQSETGYWLAKRAWQMRICGRSAVGVGLGRKPDLADKVYHASCKDRLCPACNARQLAKAAPAVKRLLQSELEDGQRLFFCTLTVRHKLSDELLDTRAVLDKAWGRLIRTKWFKETFGERLRCAEIEYTADNGWHPHFHLLLRLRPGCKASWWSHDKVENELKRLWRRSTRREGRESWQVDLRELVAKRDSISGEIESVHYWLRPPERKRYLRLEEQGKVRLLRKNGHLYREQTLHDVVEELCKYVTKRQADGLKPNQESMWDWSPERLREYAIGIRYWNLRRASKGWEQILIEFREDEQLAREVEEDQAGGYQYLPWAEITENCRNAALNRLGRAQADAFAADYPRVLRALETHGCDISADMIRGYILRFFGDDGAPVQPLRAKPWELSAWRDEKAARAILELGKQEQANALQRKYRARHWRVLIKLRRQHDKGIAAARVTGLNMSRKRTAEVMHDLQRDGLVREIDLDGTPGRYELSEEARRLLPTTLPDPRERHRRRKAARDLQRALPGLMVQEDDRDG